MLAMFCQLRGTFSVIKTLPALCCKYQSSYTAKEQREFLSEIRGGSVDLFTDSTSGIATVVINHERRKNAFSGEMMVQLCDIVDELEGWKDGRGVILRGAGDVFCSGGDLTLMKTLVASSRGTDMSNFMQNTLTRFYRLPLLSIAFVEGKALGGGAEVAVACDFRAFARNSSIGFVQSKLGLSPGWGGGVRLVELIGRKHALRMLASGVIYSGEEASQIGLADYVVGTGQGGFDEVVAIMRQLASACSPFVQQAAKRVVVNASAVDFEAKLKGECAIFGSVWSGPAHISALNANVRFKA